MNFHPEALLHLCDEPAHLEKPPHVRLHLRLRTSVRFEKSKWGLNSGILCNYSLRLAQVVASWQGFLSLLILSIRDICHFVNQHHFHFSAQNVTQKNTAKEDFLHQKTSKTHSFLTLWLQLKKITPAPHMLHVTNIGYGPQSTFINAAKKWFWQFCCKMLTFAGDDTLKLLPAWGAAYALKL